MIKNVIDYAALVERLHECGSYDTFQLCAEAADAIERLTQPGGEAEPVAYVVFDEDGPGFCAGWESACHEHINDAINEHDCVEAAKWKVVAVSPTADLARLIAERDENTQELGRQILRHAECRKERDNLNAANVQLFDTGHELFNERNSLQDQVKVLRELLPKRISNGFVSFGKYYSEQEDKFADPYNVMSRFKRKYLDECEEALAATEPQEPDNIHRNEVDHDGPDRPEMPDY